MNKSLRIIITIQIFIVGLFSACSKDSYTEKKKIEDYEINRQNSLQLFTPVMYNDLDGVHEELFKIVHISDAHVSSWSSGNHFHNPQNLQEAVLFANDTVAKINAMVATGDHIGNHIPTTHNEAVSFMNVFTNTLYKNNKIPTFTSTGNHDANMMNPNDITLYAFSKTELYNLLTSKTNYQINIEGRENYYYADLTNPMGGIIRIIALDVTDQDVMIYNAQHNAILSQRQIDWLCHTALKKDMTEHHSVIILVHHPLPPVEKEALKEVVSNDFLYNWNMVPEIIEAFRTKQTFTGKYRNKLLESDSIFINVSFNDSPGEFICYMGGHLHTYLNYEVRSSTNPTLPNQIMIIANNMSPSDKSETSPIERTDTGLRNNTFNLYAIDTKKKMIFVTFFGATGFYYPQVLTLHYL